MHISISILTPNLGNPFVSQEIIHSKSVVMSILDVEVSWFHSYLDPTPAGEMSLLQWLTSNKYQPTVEAIRMIKDKSERDAKKARLPAITPSGTFSHRSDQALLKHSGLICLDIDRKDNSHLTNFSALKAELSKIKQVAYCGLSVSGDGYFVMIPIAHPDKHQLHFQALLQLFTHFNIRLDQKCGNLSRLRGYSWDPDAYFNHQATPFTGLQAPMPNPATARRYNYHPKPGNDYERVALLVSKIEQQRIDITADYNYWFAIACNLASTFGEAGRNFFHRISQFHPEYNPLHCDSKYNDALKKCGYSNPNLGALINRCKFVLL